MISQAIQKIQKTIMIKQRSKKPNLNTKNKIQDIPRDPLSAQPWRANSAK